MCPNSGPTRTNASRRRNTRWTSYSFRVTAASWSTELKFADLSHPEKQALPLRALFSSQQRWQTRRVG